MHINEPTLPDPSLLALICLTTSLHALVLGVFLLVVKLTIWKEIALIPKLMILGALYFIYVNVISVQVDPLGRRLLGLPSVESTSNLRTSQIMLNTLPQQRP